MGMELKSGRKSNIFIIAGMEISIWTITTCLFSFFHLQELMYYSSYRYEKDQEVLSSFRRSFRDTMSKSVLKCIKRSSADRDAEEGHGYFISALSRPTLEIPSAKLNIAVSHMQGWGHVLPATGKGSAAQMKGKSEWEKDTKLKEKPQELAGDIGWVGVGRVASASELNCCHPHTYKSFRGGGNSKPGFLGCRSRSQWETDVL